MSICIRFLSVCLEMELLCHWVGLGSVLIDTVKQLSKVIIPVYTPNLNFKSVSYFQILVLPILLCHHSGECVRILHCFRFP